MRILMTVQAYFPFQDMGGPVVKVRAIARGLARRGHRVAVLTADLGSAGATRPLEAAEPCRWGWRKEEDGVETIYLRTWARVRALTFNPGVIGFGRGPLKEFDLAHLYGLYDFLGPAVGFFCIRRGIPYCVEPMGMFRPIVRSLRLKRLYHRALGQRLIRGARCVIATSGQEKKELIEGGVAEARILVRRNGIEIPLDLPERGSFRRRWSIAADTKLILFLGRLVSKKSPDLLLESFARWRAGARRPENAMLVLAGPEEGDGYLPKLKDLAIRLGLEGNVMFPGPLYDEAKWAAYRDADVFVLPSQHENFGNTAAEAVACGTPVIVTDRCGIAPLMDQRAGIVIPYGVEPLHAALTMFFEDEQTMERFRSACDEVARGLSWAEPLALMEGLYSQMVAEAAR